MNEAEEQIRALVDAETAAWNARDANALAALFTSGYGLALATELQGS